MESTIALPALRTIQAGQATYIASAPFGFVASLEQRPGRPGHLPARRPSRRRSATIIAYLLGSPLPLLPPLVLAVDGGVRFYPFSSPEGLRGCGRLLIELTAELSWIDGEKRAAGITEAVRRKPVLALDTIGLVVVAAPPLEDRARLRRDLNARSPVRNRKEPFAPRLTQHAAIPM